MIKDSKDSLKEDFNDMVIMVKVCIIAILSCVGPCLHDLPAPKTFITCQYKYSLAPMIVVVSCHTEGKHLNWGLKTTRITILSIVWCSKNHLMPGVVLWLIEDGLNLYWWIVEPKTLNQTCKLALWMVHLILIYYYVVFYQKNYSRQ